MPGNIVRAEGTTWMLDHNCFTADGTNGGPVVDLASRRIVGMHVAAGVPQDGRKRGIAIALSHFAHAFLE